MKSARCLSCRRTIIVGKRQKRCLSCTRAKRAQRTITVVVEDGWDIKVVKSRAH